MNSYWSQYSSAEILSMHGIELDEECFECDIDNEPCEPGELEQRCPCCKGHGCNFCLMVDY